MAGSPVDRLVFGIESYRWIGEGESMESRVHKKGRIVDEVFGRHDWEVLVLFGGNWNAGNSKYSSTFFSYLLNVQSTPILPFPNHPMSCYGGLWYLRTKLILGANYDGSGAVAQTGAGYFGGANWPRARSKQPGNLIYRAASFYGNSR